MRVWATWGGWEKEDGGAPGGRLGVTGGQCWRPGDPAPVCPNWEPAWEVPPAVGVLLAQSCSIPVPDEGQAVTVHVRKGGTGRAQEPAAGGWQEESEAPDPLPDDVHSVVPHRFPSRGGSVTTLSPQALPWGKIRTRSHDPHPCIPSLRSGGWGHVPAAGARCRGGVGPNLQTRFPRTQAFPCVSLGHPLCLGPPQAAWPLGVIAQRCLLYSLECP